MRRGLVVGNWKMNGGLAANARLLGRLASEWTPAESREVGVCVPAPYLVQAQAALTGSAVAWGAQDVSEHNHGAYTGEVSAAMLVEVGVDAVVLGHSERRQLFGETDEALARKVPAALAAGLEPILCVGESEEARDAGQTEAVLERQLQADLAGVDGGAIAGVVIAYEPIWAIGTGRTATPEQAQEACAFIRDTLRIRGGAGDSVRILYGGSVKLDNAAELMSQPDIDGALVGGASLDPAEFAAIVKAAG